MASAGKVPTHRKAKRRRANKQAVSARLIFVESLNNDVGVLSQDLFAELFGARTLRKGHDNRTDENAIRYVAVSPAATFGLPNPASSSCTILPIIRAKTEITNRPQSNLSLQLSSSSPALASIYEQLHARSPSISLMRRTPIEIKILDVVPLGLDTVFLEVGGHTSGELLEATQGLTDSPHPAVEGQIPKRRAPDEVTPIFPEQDGKPFSSREHGLRVAVRAALRRQPVIYSGHVLQIPVRSHSRAGNVNLHAKIILCEPVAQGLLLAETRVIVTQSADDTKTSNASPHSPFPVAMNGVAYNGHNTLSFVSADEAAPQDLPHSRQASYTWALEHPDDATSYSDEGELSDGSDIITMSGPLLQQHSASMLSSFPSATPRVGKEIWGGVQSPRFTYISNTAATVTGAKSGAKVFRARSLLESIPNSLLHPKPGNEEDEEARIYVDTSSLVRIQCFSGDWVHVLAAIEPPLESSDLTETGAWPHIGREGYNQWRPVRVYALPRSNTKSIENPSNQWDRRSSLSSNKSHPSLPRVYASPILLANLGEPMRIYISSFAPPSSQFSTNPSSSLVKDDKESAALMPPLAKEVTLLKLATPLSTERLLQPALLAGLKTHFEGKKRILKSGDIVAITIDESLGKAIFEGSAPPDEEGSDELLFSQTQMDTFKEDGIKHKAGKSAVAWFKVGSVVTVSSNESDHLPNGDFWGNIAYVDSTNTRMTQTGTEQGRVPATTTNPWRYYLGIRRLPPQRAFPLSIQETPKVFVSQTRHRLRQLISAATSARAIRLELPPIAILLTSTQRLVGKATTASEACLDLGLHVFPIDAYDILTEGGVGGSDVKTEAFLKARAERALTCGADNTALLIQHIEALDADRIVNALKEILADSRVLIATTNDVDKVSDGIRSLFTHEIGIRAPDEGEREGLLRSMVDEAGIGLASEVSLSSVAIRTAALVAGDLRDVVDRAIIARDERLQRLAGLASNTSSSDVTIKDILLAGGEQVHNLSKADFDLAVDAARKNFADAIGAPKIPNVTWDDVGGLANVKDAVMETIQLPLERPELFAKGMKKRSGILFYGPPGTGKTLLAKAIATEFSLNFFSVKGPELLNMYIGESEANVRRVFQRARDARPCVVFFDELDSVAPKRGNQGDSGGVMDRIVSQLLAELDGMSSGEEGGPGGAGGGVFVIGATNRPDLLDPALLRPGRFDKMLYLGVSDTHEKQKTILEALTRKFTLDPSLSLSRVASTLPFTYTGADLYALCSDAMLKAITRCASAVDAKIKRLNAERLSQGSEAGRIVTEAYFFDHLATPEDTAVVVTEEDFMAAKAELVPSVSVKELQHYERVRRTFEQVDTRDGARDEESREDGKATAMERLESQDDFVDGGETQEVFVHEQNGSNGMSRKLFSRAEFEEKGKKQERAAVAPYNDANYAQGGESKSMNGGAGASTEEDENEFIIRTDHLSINSGADKHMNGLANKTPKDKGKTVDYSDGFQDPARMDEEELYA